MTSGVWSRQGLNFCLNLTVNLIILTFNIYFQFGSVENGNVFLISNLLNYEFRIISKIMIFVLHQTVIGLAIVKVFWKPGAIDAVAADHAPGFRVEGHVGASHK